MFDFGFGEMMIIGAVGLVVLGPERLPTVARTAGEWIGKAQRFVAQIKDDINRETELSELKRIQEEAQKLATDFKSTVEKTATEIESSSSKVANDLKAVGNDAQKTMESLESAASEASESATTTATSSETGSTVTGTVKPYSNNEIADFYGWNDVPENVPEPTYVWKEPKTFSKRYRSGPSVDELAREIERLRHELGMRETQLNSSNRRLTARARSNRPRIYR